MFDYVNVQMPCPNCGELHKNFQSKEGRCTLDTIEPDGLSNFYGPCSCCGAWIEFNRPLPKQSPTHERPKTREEVEAMGFVLSVTMRSKPLNVQHEQLANTEEAWLFFCSKPGRRMVFASLDSSGSESWPWDEWKLVQRVRLVPIGERETLLDKRSNALTRLSK